MSFIAASIAAVSGGLKIAKGLHQDHLANKVDVPNVSYETSPYALQMLGEARQI